MSGPDDRSPEMLTADELGVAIDLMLRGIVVDPALEPAAHLVDDLSGITQPPPPSPELAAVLAGRPVGDHELSPGAAAATHIARSCVPVAAVRRPSRRGTLVARASARFATLSLAAKAGLGLTLAGATAAAGAGAAGVLPDPAVDAVRRAIEVITPFELPDRAAAARGPEATAAGHKRGDGRRDDGGRAAVIVTALPPAQDAGQGHRTPTDRSQTTDAWTAPTHGADATAPDAPQHAVDGEGGLADSPSSGTPPATGNGGDGNGGDDDAARAHQPAAGGAKPSDGTPSPAANAEAGGQAGPPHPAPASGAPPHPAPASGAPPHPAPASGAPPHPAPASGAPPHPGADPGPPPTAGPTSAAVGGPPPTPDPATATIGAPPRSPGPDPAAAPSSRVLPSPEPTTHTVETVPATVVPGAGIGRSTE